MSESEETPDHDLMLAVRDGDTAQLGTLFERHHRPLYGFFVKLTGQNSASEDLVQQVFYRILKYRHTYRDEGSFRTWMYHLARRVASDHYRRGIRTPTPLDNPDELHEIPDQSPHAAQAAEQQDNLNLLRKALMHLPGDQRELLTLHRFQQLSHEELAEIHGCSIGAIKVRVHRALNHLKERFLQLQASPGLSD